MRGPFSRKRDDDLRAEMQTHIDRATSERVARGMSADEAQREARREFGNLAHAREVTREQWGWIWLEQLGQDVRYAFRSLRKNRGFTAVAVLSLGLGIGANTAIFSLMDAVVLRSLPVRHPEQLVAITNGIGAIDIAHFSNPGWEQLRDHAGLFNGSLAYSGVQFPLTQGGESRMVLGTQVSGSFFDVLGVRAVAGRVLQRTDDVRGCAGVVAVSAGFAAREFGDVGAAVGRTLSLSGTPFVIVGVIDPHFAGVTVGQQSDIYAPLCWIALVRHDPKALDDGHTLFLSILGRLPDGMSIRSMNARLALQAAAILGPDAPTGNDQSPRLSVVAAAGGISGVRQAYRAALIVLMVVVAFVLLIACANIANLLLARAASRGREMAIRLAVGAGRRRLVRQLLTESLILSVTGAAIGVVFARWAERFLVGYLSTGRLPVALDLAINPAVLAFTIGVALLTGVLFGLAPAWRAARTDPQLAMKAGGRGAVRGARAHRLGRTLVVGQVALSLVLVAGAGLLVGSFRVLDTQSPGFERGGVLIAHLNFDPAGYKDAALTNAENDALRRIRLLPGVAAASMSLVAPLGGGNLIDGVLAPGFAPARESDAHMFFNSVSDGYFATMRTALRAGRDISPDDVRQARLVAVINETMARRVYGTANPIGRTFEIGDVGSATAPIEVIGVVEDARHNRLDDAMAPMAYLPLGAWGPPTGAASYEIRSARSQAELVRDVTAAVTAVSPAIGVQFTTLSAMAEPALARPRMLAVLSGFFGALALVLAMIGLYGTIAYSVAQRRNEIGVRMALGAGRYQVLRMVTGDAARIVVVGVALGVLLTIAGTRFLGALLFGITATDPATIAASAAALIVTGLAAASIPAWRGATIDPVAALREE